MRIKWSFTSQDVVWIDLNEAYFRFEPMTFRRVGYMGVNNANFSSEQKTFCKKLCSVKREDKLVFMQVYFNRRGIQIVLSVSWNSKLQEVVEDMIKESWPSLFIKA